MLSDWLISVLCVVWNIINTKICILRIHISTQFCKTSAIKKKRKLLWRLEKKPIILLIFLVWIKKKIHISSKMFEDVHRFRKITRNVSVWKIQICKCQNVLCMYVILFVWWHIYLKKEHERTFPNFHFHEKKVKTVMCIPSLNLHHSSFPKRMNLICTTTTQKTIGISFSIDWNRSICYQLVMCFG